MIEKLEKIDHYFTNADGKEEKATWQEIMMKRFEASCFSYISEADPKILKAKENLAKIQKIQTEKASQVVELESQIPPRPLEKNIHKLEKELERRENGESKLTEASKESIERDIAVLKDKLTETKEFNRIKEGFEKVTRESKKKTFEFFKKMGIHYYSEKLFLETTNDDLKNLSARELLELALDKVNNVTVFCINNDPKTKDSIKPGEKIIEYSSEDFATKEISKEIYATLELNKDNSANFVKSALDFTVLVLENMKVDKDLIDQAKAKMSEKLSDIHKEYNKKPEGIVEKISQCLKDVYLFCKTGTRNSEVKEKLNTAIKEINKDIFEERAKKLGSQISVHMSENQQQNSTINQNQQKQNQMLR